MASGDLTKSVGQSAEALELNRDVLSVLAHELGGIASALDLRTAAMSRVVSENDLAALREMAEQVRMATRAARFARGADSLGMLNPNKLQSLDDWWRLTERFTSAVLPRGVAVESRFDEAFVTAVQASALTWIWLAGCKEIADRGVQTPAQLVLQGGPAGGTNRTQLSAEIRSSTGGSADSSGSRWSTFSSGVARELGTDPPSWKQDDGVLRWSVEVPNVATAATT